MITAGKAAVMYGIALVGLRVAHRRTLSQWTTIDFAAAVAMGAITALARSAGVQTRGSRHTASSAATGFGSSTSACSTGSPHSGTRSAG